MKLYCNEKLSVFDIRKLGIYFALLAATIWLLLYYYAPPMFSGTDVFDFKDPGINLARGLGLVTRISPSNPNIEYRFFGEYPPLFPVLYGLVVWIFGISAKVNTIFDVFLAFIAGLTFWFAIQPRWCHRSCLLPNFLIFLLLILALPLGPFWADHERPDNLGFTLTMISIVIIGHKFEPKRTFWAGLILGINAMVSPFTALINVTAIVALLVNNRYERREDALLPKLLPNLLIFITGVLIPIITILTATWSYDPQSIVRFFSHATGTSTGGHTGLGYFLKGDYLNAIYRYNILIHKVKIIFLMLVLLLTIGYLIGFASFKNPMNIILVVIIMMISCIPILLFPYQSNYMSLAAAVNLVLFARLIKVDSARQLSNTRWIIFAAMAFIAVFEMLFIIRDFIIAYDSSPSYQRMVKVLEGIKDSYGATPPLVATAPSTYFLFKGRGFDVVNLNYIHKLDDLIQMDFLAFSFVGSGNPIKSVSPTDWDSSRFELVYRPDLPQQTKFSGHRISKSSNIWEVELYKRK